MQDVQDIVNSSVAMAKDANPKYQIITTCHSLGAGVAALLGTYMRNQGNS
jgi:putative lipase involved disintegration of autophagic bodies